MKPKDIIVVKANRTYRIDGRKVKEIKLLEIGVKRTNGEWRAYFRIGVQTFYLSSVPTKS